MKDLREMTAKELKEIAKEMKISNWWNLKKDVLIAKIEEKQNMTDEEKQIEAEQKAREDAAMEIYNKDWRKYTARYNPVEFIEKFRAGEIDLDDEETEELDEVMAEEDKLPEATNEEKEDESPETETSEEQPKPKRGALIEFNGKSQNICKWGEELGISPNTLYGRIYKMGWPVERAFTTPARKGGNK